MFAPSSLVQEGTETLARVPAAQAAQECSRVFQWNGSPVPLTLLSCSTNLLKRLPRLLPVLVRGTDLILVGIVKSTRVAILDGRRMEGNSGYFHNLNNRQGRSREWVAHYGLNLWGNVYNVPNRTNMACVLTFQDKRSLYESMKVSNDR